MKPKCSKCGNYKIKDGICFEPCQGTESYIFDLEAVVKATKEFLKYYGSLPNTGRMRDALKVLEIG